MAIRPYSKNIWFSPNYVINELAKTIQSGNQKKIDKNKEAWVCAVALICRAKAEPAEWWIQIPEKDPPDVLAMHLIPHVSGKGNSLSEQPVEIFEISEFDKGEKIEESIKRKLKDKDYAGNMVIGFVRRQEPFDHIWVSNYIKKIKPNSGAVYLIVNEENNTNFSFVGIFPDCFKYKCDWGAFCKTGGQKDFVDMERSTVIKKSDCTTNDTMTMIPELK